MRKDQAFLKQESQTARPKLTHSPKEIVAALGRKLFHKHVKHVPQASLRSAAAQMAEAYQNDRELTAMASLDGDDFLPTPAPE